MLHTLPTPLAALMLALSFIGLCAFARVQLRANRFVAPCLSASAVIVILMLAGMAHILPIGFGLLFFGGLAGLVYAYVIRRARPDWPLIAGFMVFAGALAWRMLGVPLTEWDDLSHWGLVARYLLQTDAFPDATAKAVTFQSYPLGAACFIYYIGKALGNTEGVYLFAQNLLYGLFFLPVFAHIRGNRRILCPALTFAFLLLFRFNRDLTNLFTDWLVAFMGIGAAASVIYERKSLPRAMLAGIPGIIAVAFTKNSGLFFSLTTALLLGWVAYGPEKNKKRFILTAAGALGVGLLFFFLWTMHVRMDFVAGMSSKHAVSLSSYARNAGKKSLISILGIGARMLLALVKPYFFQVFTLLCAIAGFLMARHTGKGQPDWEAKRQAATRALIACVICYIVWYFLIFLMYVFSMPLSEARRLASCWRYSSTGMVFCLGMELVILMRFYSDCKLSPKSPGMLAGAAAVCLAVAPFMVEQPASYYSQFVVRNTQYNDLRAGVIRAREEYDLPEDGHYLTFSGGDTISAAVNAYYRAAKYDLNSLNIDSISRIVEHFGETTDEYTLSVGRQVVPSPVPFLEEHLDEYDAFLILFQDDEFEGIMDEFMKTYDGSTPIVFIYR